MAASLTVPQLPSSLNSSIESPRLSPIRGTITLFGYGISVRVDRGHLVVEDGIGQNRHVARFPRVGHGLRRLTVVGADGVISLAAIRWLADQKASFVMLDRDGSVLVATGPIGPKDARLRRAQALARGSAMGLKIAQDLIGQKLREQERIVREVFRESSAADAIAEQRERLTRADTLESLRVVEAHAALTYWGCWRALPIVFPKADLQRTPRHWRTFGTRISPLTGSPRLSVNPPNAILNYVYAILESEARLAAVAMGLDPGLGILHSDMPARDNLACDLMEPVRPHVDAFLLNWLTRQPFRREWFFEERNGNCRLMGHFAEQLSRTASTWAQAVAPITERVVKALWSTKKATGLEGSRPATRLTQQHRREATGGSVRSIQAPPHPLRLCGSCGGPKPKGETNCARCAAPGWRKNMRAVAVMGRRVSHTPKAQAQRVAARRRNALAEAAWQASDQPGWLTERAYVEQIQPKLATISGGRLARALQISKPYAAAIRTGRRRPHPRHWKTLAGLAGVREPNLLRER